MLLQYCETLKNNKSYAELRKSIMTIMLKQYSASHYGLNLQYIFHWQKRNEWPAAHIRFTYDDHIVEKKMVNTASTIYYIIDINKYRDKRQHHVFNETAKGLSDDFRRHRFTYAISPLYINWCVARQLCISWTAKYIAIKYDN